jgi:uncharacterized protein (DUF2164 family)
MKEFEFAKEIKQDLIRNVQEFFLKEREEEISEFQAAAFLEFVVKDIGPYIYNQALKDAHTLLSNSIEDLYGLEKRAR